MNPSKREVIFHQPKPPEINVETDEKWGTTHHSAQELDSCFRWLESQETDSLTRSDLHEKIYQEYFTQSSTFEKFEGDIEKIQGKSDAVEKQLREVELELKEAERPFLQIEKSGKRHTWLYAYINGGIDREQPQGRLYLNLSATEMHTIYKDLVLLLTEKAIENNEMRVEIKTVRRCTAVELSRREKVVIYFNDTDAEQLVLALRELANTHIDLLMQRSKMPFTLKLAPVDGESLGAVSFAQTPEVDSFGQNRANLILRTAKKIKINRKMPFIAYKDECRMMRIDPLYPAFSTNGRKSMPNITKRLLMNQ